MLKMNLFLLVITTAAASAASASDFKLKPPPTELQIHDTQDYIKSNLHVMPGTEQLIHGEDHIFLDKKRNRLVIFGMDQKIYTTDINTGATALLGQAPGVGTGGKFDPNNPDKLYFCAANEQGVPTATGAANGLYVIDFASDKNKISPVLTRVLKDQVPADTQGVVYPFHSAPSVSTAELDHDSESFRPFGICDDLAFSADGKRIYIAEPYDTQGGGFGDEKTGKMNQQEVLLASRHGKVWMLDLAWQKLSLIATGFAFVDGIAVEKKSTPATASTDEEHILFTELSRYHLIRASIAKNTSHFEILLENMPGMTNAMETDRHGRIYMAINKYRTGMLDFSTNLPTFLQNIILNLPDFVKPIPKSTGFLILSPNAKGSYSVQFTAFDDSGSIGSITHVLPDFENQTLYLAVEDRNFAGVHSVPLPEK